VCTIKASPGGGATTLGGETAISGGGTPDTGCGTPFRPVPAEFNHWTHRQRAFSYRYLFFLEIHYRRRASAVKHIVD